MENFTPGTLRSGYYCTSNCQSIDSISSSTPVNCLSRVGTLSYSLWEVAIMRQSWRALGSAGIVGIAVFQVLGAAPGAEPQAANLLRLPAATIEPSAGSCDRRQWQGTHRQ